MGIIRKVKGKYHDNMITRSYYHSISALNVERYLQNERNMRILGEDIMHLPDYKYAVQLHEYLKLYDIDDSGKTEFRRIGRNNDGGYVMISPFSEVPIAYSIGIYHDVSWDLNMVEEGYEIYQYDHTINNLPETNEKFHWKKIGLGEKDDPTAKLQTLETMIKENGHDSMTGMLLKMDVEGCEWKVLDTLPIEALKRFDQIAMEMHGFVYFNNREIIIRVLKKISEAFACVHIHANNFGGVDYCGNYLIPQLLEVTMVNRNKRKLKESSRILPINLDQPCNSIMPDIILGRWNA